MTYNDPAETERVLAALEARVGSEGVLRLPAPSMASEDFAYVLEEVPGTLVFLGVAPDEGSTPMHSETAVFDDSILDVQAALLAGLAWERLHER
ncbi:M20/M25/M40 family metallo-hydrolase [Microbacterium sp. NIBRBAC000506063]|uniref:M20/M25/M40 family metallo-hydrolase n=1 Tax=Microbacterium sp. NIBRBAC000506063 TaxID=2734618 RepID=UPI002948BC63|nr:M20/M25/M40 family metallo-hydrolase [Microbacterium sp. NIBRBAC000506063]